jgi:hypothetical protein
MIAVEKVHPLLYPQVSETKQTVLWRILKRMRMFGRMYSLIGKSYSHPSPAVANAALSRRDHRTRSDRVRIQTQKWNDQMPRLTSAFVNWRAGIKPAVSSSEKSWFFPVYSFESVLSYLWALSSLKQLFKASKNCHSPMLKVQKVSMRRLLPMACLAAHRIYQLWDLRFIFSNVFGNSTESACS